MRILVLFLTSVDNERAHSEGKSTPVVSEPGGACPPTSGCLMADQIKQGCLELEGRGETGNNLCRAPNLSVCVLRMVLTFAGCFYYAIDYCSCFVLITGKKYSGDCLFYICSMYAY